MKERTLEEKGREMEERREGGGRKEGGRMKITRRKG